MIAVTSQFWAAGWLHDHVAAVESQMVHIHRSPDVWGGIVGENSAHHRGALGSIGTCPARGHMVHPCSHSERELFCELPMKGPILRRNLFWEGIVNILGGLCSPRRERGDPRLKRRPRHMGTNKRHSAHAMSMNFQWKWCTVPGVQGWSGAKAPADVGPLSKVCYLFSNTSNHAPSQSMGFTIKHQIFTDSLASYQ